MIILLPYKVIYICKYLKLYYFYIYQLIIKIQYNNILFLFLIILFYIFQLIIYKSKQIIK